MSIELIIYLMNVISGLELAASWYSVFGAALVGLVSIITVVVARDEEDKPLINTNRKASVFALLLSTILWFISVFVIIVSPSEETMEKMVAVHLGKQFIDKAPQELKDEPSKLPVNVAKRLNDMLADEKEEIKDAEHN